MVGALNMLSTCDILIFFGWLCGMMPLHKILNSGLDISTVSNEMNIECYKEYVQRMNDEYGEGKYVHDFELFWIRTLKMCDNSIISEIVPAIESPVKVIIWWAKHRLNVSDSVMQKLSLLYRLPFAAPVQLQGAFECHYRKFVQPLYVLHFIHISCIFYIYFVQISYIFYTHSLMPTDCKKNPNMSPAYDFSSYAYHHRKKLELNPVHLYYLWNCGKVKYPTPSQGIMNLEQKNGQLKQYEWQLSSQSITKGYLNSILFQFSTNIITYNYWVNQTAKDVSLRTNQLQKTWKERFPRRFEAMAHIINGTINMSLFRDTFVSRNDNTMRMVTIVQHNQETLKHRIYQLICQNCITWRSEPNWTSQHWLILWCLLHEKRWIYVNDAIMHKIFKYFNGKFEKKDLWSYARTIGAIYQGANKEQF